MDAISPIPVVFENGTMLGSLGHERSASRSQVHIPSSALPLVIPEIVINSSQNINSIRSHALRCSRHDISKPHGPDNLRQTLPKEEVCVEHASLQDTQQEGLKEEFEFERFILNCTTSESNEREFSTCSEQLPCFQMSPSPALAPEMLNSTCSSRSDSESRWSRKTLKAKTKRTSTLLAIHATSAPTAPNGYPPQYTAILLDPHHRPDGNALLTNERTTGAGVAASFVSGSSGTGTDASRYLHYHQYCQSRPIIGSLGLELTDQHHLAHHERRTLLDVAVTLPGNNEIIPLACNNLPVVSRSTANLNPRYNLRKWFSRPSLPFVIGIFALGGVACTLGGIVLGSTGLIEHSTQYLSAALLMIGIGVSLLVISGAIWRLSLPDDVDECPCFRRMESCRNCNSPQCNNRVLTGSYIYPEFHHRPPPPSYLTSINEYAFFYHHAAHFSTSTAAFVGINTPPPMYHSTLDISAPVNCLSRFSLSQASEDSTDDQLAVVTPRSAISQTPSKEETIDPILEAEPLMRGTEVQALYREAELD